MEFNFQEFTKEALPIIVSGAICIIIVFVLTRIVKNIARAYEKKRGKSTLTKLIESIVNIILWLGAIAYIGSKFDGFSNALSTLLASSGILALGFSLAAQESLSNIIDGLFISVYKPFDIGDRITLPEKNLTGIVTKMNLRHTVITTFNNTNYIISNRFISDAIIENSSDNDSYSHPIDIEISYDSDIDKAMTIMANIIGNHPSFIDKRCQEDIDAKKPKVKVFFKAYGASGIQLRASMVTKDVGTSFASCSEIRYQIKKEFDKQGIKFPYQTITIDSKGTTK